ncbi:MAG: hypothetical protein Sylvanvirus16_6 [Sylvanvirus sp.]|uniref:Uncharacterized protein n=1 Tax=Sylvanvirus sp. TaxID=2487774 RepID=A0A3G5AIC5_9VIRU|nr:MAG: hypothetical protein Sylvanvirus16_6 [Sylvanvirus sp.]
MSDDLLESVSNNDSKVCESQSTFFVSPYNYYPGRVILHSYSSKRKAYSQAVLVHGLPLQGQSMTLYCYEVNESGTLTNKSEHSTMYRFDNESTDSDLISTSNTPSSPSNSNNPMSKDE